eukprot:TRINITY_DN8352_c0_g2_i1.p1 TRINITY_DN8352_c0_g2~~TRINITY_DN8352_c0_g2_i1.p1  ORF type:complete len:701 (+),score=193.02 TRINITY_DN8352_c0_g2_i1:33-2105(+)
MDTSWMGSSESMTLQHARDIVAALQTTPRDSIRRDDSTVYRSASPVASRIGDSIAGLVTKEVERELAQKEETISYLTSRLVDSDKEILALKSENKRLTDQVDEYKRAIVALRQKVCSSFDAVLHDLESPKDAYFRELEKKVENLEQRLSEQQNKSPSPVRAAPEPQRETPSTQITQNTQSTPVALTPDHNPLAATSQVTTTFASPDFATPEREEPPSTLRSEMVQNIFNTAIHTFTTLTKEVVTDPQLLKSGWIPSSRPKPAKSMHISWFKPVLRFMQAARERRKIQPLTKRGVKTYIPVALGNVTGKGSNLLEIEGAKCMLSIPLGLQPPKVAGRWEPMLKEGKLFKLVQNNGKSKTILFYNGTREMMFTLDFLFDSASKLVAGPSVVVIGKQYRVSVLAGETVTFVNGVLGGFNMTVNYGPPGKEHLSEYSKKYNDQITEHLQLIKQAAAKNGVDIRKEREVVKLCMKEGLQYVDAKFPPRQTALARQWEVLQGRKIDEWPWMRPIDYLTPEVASSVSLFSSLSSEDDEPIQPNDIDQGKLGDCWLLCAISAMAEQPELIRKVFYVPEVDPREQECGAYCLRVCKHGWWQTVTVDNYLPSHGKGPVFASNIQEPSELWVAILEKVVAKVHGSYSAIISGDAIEALQDLTGYPAERFRWEDDGLFETEKSNSHSTPWGRPHGGEVDTVD